MYIYGNSLELTAALLQQRYLSNPDDKHNSLAQRYKIDSRLMLLYFKKCWRAVVVI